MNKHLLLFFIFAVQTAVVKAQFSTSNSDTLNFGFEKLNATNELPNWWHLMSPNKKQYLVKTDSDVKHSGTYSLYIASVDTAQKPKFAGLGYSLPGKYLGKEITVKSWMCTADMKGSLALMLGLYDADGNNLAFENLEKQKIKGTREWKQYSVTLPMPENTQFIHIGPILIGRGKLWVDDIEVLIDGKLITQAPLKPNYTPNPPRSPRYGSIDSVGHNVKLKDATLYYETYGTGDPLLLLHGNSQSIYAFAKQIPDLSKKYKVIAVDTRGQGRSTDKSQGPLSYDQFADDMKQLLDSLHISKANVLGWSDGGNTGLIMAIKYPAYINKLAVTGAVLFPTTDAVDASTLRAVKKALDRIGNSIDPKQIIQKRLLTMLLNEPHISVESLKTISAPTLVMAGERDMIREKHTRLIAKNIFNSKLVIFKGATHYVPVEKVKDFNQTVIQFFEQSN
jgi:pimeloyl-ACP methyl ester carboxylesterase